MPFWAFANTTLATQQFPQELHARCLWEQLDMALSLTESVRIVAGESHDHNSTINGRLQTRGNAASRMGLSQQMRTRKRRTASSKSETEGAVGM